MTSIPELSQPLSPPLAFQPRLESSSSPSSAMVKGATCSTTHSWCTPGRFLVISFHPRAHLQFSQDKALARLQTSDRPWPPTEPPPVRPPEAHTPMSTTLPRLPRYPTSASLSWTFRLHRSSAPRNPKNAPALWASTHPGSYPQRQHSPMSFPLGSKRRQTFVLSDNSLPHLEPAVQQSFSIHYFRSTRHRSRTALWFHLSFSHGSFQYVVRKLAPVATGTPLFYPSLGRSDKQNSHSPVSSSSTRVVSRAI